MATATSYFDRPSPIRPGLSHIQRSPASPHTPSQQRTVSSTLNSPSLSYRSEEDALIFEFGARHFSAGFTGESCPRCRTGFGPEESRRLGDYRRWLPGHNERKRRKTRVETWGDDYELWRMDLRYWDLGLVEDKIERAVREAYTKHLLVDAKARRLMVVVPSIMPHQLLSTMLHTLFNNFSLPSITLLSPPILSTVAAGCRSSLVVDIGWRETVVTAVYDYRELSTFRTTRAMRLMTLEMAKILDYYDNRDGSGNPTKEAMERDVSETLTVDVDQAEEVTTRMAWCQLEYIPPDKEISEQKTPTSETVPPVTEQTSQPPSSPNNPNSDPQISIPSPSNPRLPLHIPFSKFAQPVTTALLVNPPSNHPPDDEDNPLPLLIYKTLLALPPDIRATCMSRITFTGGGAQIPGLQPRLLSEVTQILKLRGWNPICGSNIQHAAEKARKHHVEKIQLLNTRPPSANQTPTPTTHICPLCTPSPPAPPTPSSLLPQTTDPITEALSTAHIAHSHPPTPSGQIRGVETLGAWAGASLLSNLRIKGVVDIDREAFLQHGGLAGAKSRREMDAAVGGKGRKGLVRGMSMGGIGEGGVGGWTLGGWA